MLFSDGNSKKSDKMAVSMVTGVVRKFGTMVENAGTQPKRRSDRLTSQAQAKPPNQPQTSAQGKNLLVYRLFIEIVDSITFFIRSGQSQRLSWTQNKLVSSTPNVIGSDIPKSGKKKMPIKPNRAAGKAPGGKPPNVTTSKTSKQ